MDFSSWRTWQKFSHHHQGGHVDREYPHKQLGPAGIEPTYVLKK